MQEGYHQVTFSDGSVYSGEWQQGTRWGVGKQTYALTGNTYKGSWVDGRWHGDGLLTLANGSSYEGAWKEGRRHGYGTESDDRETYRGEFYEDVRSGVGELTDLYGNVLDVKYSVSGEMVWKREAVTKDLKPMMPAVLFVHPNEPRYTPKKLDFDLVFSSLLSPRAPAPKCQDGGVRPKVEDSHSQWRGSVQIPTQDLSRQQRSEMVHEGGRRMGIELSPVGPEPIIKASFVWSPMLSRDPRTSQAEHAQRTQEIAEGAQHLADGVEDGCGRIGVGQRQIQPARVLAFSDASLAGEGAASPEQAGTGAGIGRHGSLTRENSYSLFSLSSSHSSDDGWRLEEAPHCAHAQLMHPHQPITTQHVVDQADLGKALPPRASSERVQGLLEKMASLEVHQRWHSTAHAQRENPTPECKTDTSTEGEGSLLPNLREGSLASLLPNFGEDSLVPNFQAPNLPSSDSAPNSLDKLPPSPPSGDDVLAARHSLSPVFPRVLDWPMPEPPEANGQGASCTLDISHAYDSGEEARSAQSTLIGARLQPHAAKAPPPLAATPPRNLSATRPLEALEPQSETRGEAAEVSPAAVSSATDQVVGDDRERWGFGAATTRDPSEARGDASMRISCLRKHGPDLGYLRTVLDPHPLLPTEVGARGEEEVQVVSVVMEGGEGSSFSPTRRPKPLRADLLARFQGL